MCIEGIRKLADPTLSFKHSSPPFTFDGFVWRVQVVRSIGGASLDVYAECELEQSNIVKEAGVGHYVGTVDLAAGSSVEKRQCVDYIKFNKQFNPFAVVGKLLATANIAALLEMDKGEPEHNLYIDVDLFPKRCFSD